MSARWVKLTPTDPAHGTEVLVNLDRATSIWAHDDGGSEIWFGAQHEDEKFTVQETLSEIEGAPPTLFASA